MNRSIDGLGTIVLGIDPGSEAHGLARLRRTPSAWDFLACERASNFDFISRWILRSDLVCIEEPAHVHPRKGLSPGAHIATGSSLVKTSHHVADLRVFCTRHKVPCVLLSCHDARRAMGIKGARQDLTTAIALKRLVNGWPSRSNAHVRDAAIVAITGHAKWLVESAVSR